MAIRGGRTLRCPTCWLRWPRAWVTIAACTRSPAVLPTLRHTGRSPSLCTRSRRQRCRRRRDGSFVSPRRRLRGAVSAMQSGTTVLMAPGRYRITAPLAIANVQDVAICGESGRAEDTVIEGPGLEWLESFPVTDEAVAGRLRPPDRRTARARRLKHRAAMVPARYQGRVGVRDAHRALSRRPIARPSSPHVSVVLRRRRRISRAGVIPETRRWLRRGPRVASLRARL